jgi:hypothetical protein
MIMQARKEIVARSVAGNHMEMIMRSDFRRIFLTILAATAFSASAVAGLKSSLDVAISDDYTFAYGDLGHVHNTSDRIQSIGCQFSGSSGWCLAYDLNGVQRSCWSSDARWVRTMAAIKSDSYVAFYWDAGGNCTYIAVQNDSIREPK